MKKLVLAFVFMALFAPFIASATTEDLPNNTTWLILQPKITNTNYNTTIEKHKITQTWMTSQRMTTKLTVIDHNRNTNYVFEDEFYFISTYHVMSFSLPEGKYTLIPESKDYKTGKVSKGIPVEITIK